MITKVCILLTLNQLNRRHVMIYFQHFLIKTMKTVIFITAIFFCLISCRKEKVSADFIDRKGSIEIHRCYCSESAYRYLIVINENNEIVRYNPVNLPNSFKDDNYLIEFSANLLNDSSIVYTNTATDALIENFRIRNISLVDIKKRSE